MSYASTTIKRLRYLINRDADQLLVLEKNNGAFDIISLDTPAARDAAVSTAVNNLLAGVPGALDTLNELATALGDDANFAATVTTALGNRLAWKGPWAPSTIYVRNDIVMFNGGLYVAPGNFTSGITFNKTSWTELVPQIGVYAHGVELSDYCLLDGVSDDSASFVMAVAVAAAEGIPLIGMPGKTMLVATSIVFDTNNGIFDGRGMTIKKKSTMTAEAMIVSAVGADVRNLTVDGNRATGATGNGIKWTGTGTAVNVESRSNGTNAWKVTGVGAVLDAYQCRAYDSGFDGSFTDGFHTDTGGLVRLHDCDSSYNRNAGVFADSSAANGCYVDGNFDGNGGTAVWLNSQQGTIGRIVGRRNNGFGLILSLAIGWNIDFVGFTDTGLGFTTPYGRVYANNNSGTSVELTGATNNKIGTIQSTRPLGYSFAVAKSTDGNDTPSTYNEVGVVIADQANAIDHDPGIHFSGGSHHNRIGLAEVRGHPCSLIIGEDTTPKTNNYNTIGTLIASLATEAAVIINGGSYNTIDRVIARDVPCTLSGTYQGVVSFVNAEAFNNKVNWLEYLDTGAGLGTPSYLAYADALAVGNVVADGIRAGYGVSSHLDSNGSNAFYPLVKGRLSISGVPDLTVPGVPIGLQTATTLALATGNIYYEAFHCDTEITFSHLYAEITTAPVSAANLRIGIYRADINNNPKGVALTDQEIAVASGFTGVKNVATALALPRGRYVKAVMVDVAMTLRAQLGATGIQVSMGSSPATVVALAPQAYGAMPGPAPVTATRTNGTNGSRHTVLLRISAP